MKEKLEFPNAKLNQSLAKDSARFHNNPDPDSPDLWIRDDSIRIFRWDEKTASVSAFLWKTGHKEEIVLPEIDVDNKLLKFHGVSREDEIIIHGNHYEILCDKKDGGYLWHLK